VKTVDDSFRFQELKMTLNEKSKSQKRKDWFEDKKTSSNTFDNIKSHDMTPSVRKMYLFNVIK